jgi:hypothetical protein
LSRKSERIFEISKKVAQWPESQSMQQLACANTLGAGVAQDGAQIHCGKPIMRNLKDRNALKRVTPATGRRYRSGFGWI